MPRIDLNGRIVYIRRDTDEPWRKEYLCFSHAVRRVASQLQKIDAEVELYTPEDERQYSYSERVERECIDCRSGVV